VAAYFASFENIPSYTVKNSKKGTIGQIIGSGIILQPSGDLKNVLICVDIDYPSNNADYNTYDFANVDATYSYVIPLEVNAYVNEVQQLCTMANPVKGSTTFIPVKRVKDWANVKQTFFTSSTLGYLYALGVLYIIVAAFAFVLIVGVFIFTVTGAIKSFQITTIVTFSIFVFTLLRAIYFFVVPTGLLSHNGSVAEYVLIVLPTFPYFTAFSCIPLAWALLTDGSLRKTGNNRRMLSLVSVVNAVLYILFIIIVVIFNSTKKIVSIQCLGNNDESTKLTNGQNGVSIAYSVIVSALSLTIAIAFVFFGQKIVQLAKHDQIIVRTYRMVLVCSIAFMINCLFILIITGAKLYNVHFSFAGLLVSEIVPSVFMLTSFGSLDILRKIIFRDKNSIKSSSGTSSTGGDSSSNNNSSAQSSAVSVSSRSESS